MTMNRLFFVWLMVLIAEIAARPADKTYGHLMGNLPVDILTAQNDNIFLRRNGEMPGSYGGKRVRSLRSGIGAAVRRPRRSPNQHNNHAESEMQNDTSQSDESAQYAVRRTTRVVNGRPILTCMCMGVTGPVAWNHCHFIRVDCDKVV